MRLRKAQRKFRTRVGRPPKYKGAETIKKTKEYIDSCEDTVEVVNTGLKVYTRPIVKIPLIEGLCLVLGVSKQQIDLWKDTYEEFRYVLNELKAKQAKMLLENGLSGKYNQTITKLVLSSNHGYREKSEIKHQGKIEHEYDDEQIRAIAERVTSDGGNKSKTTPDRLLNRDKPKLSS